MGWTWTKATIHKQNGEIDRKAMCDDLFKEESIIKSAMVGTTYYAAVRSSMTGEVYAAIIPTMTNKKDWFDFGYKAMDETVGPIQQDCPASIINLLSPTDDEYSLQWREKCLKHSAAKRANASKDARLRKFRRYSIISFINPHDNLKDYEKGKRIFLTKYYSAAHKKEVWCCERYIWQPKFIPADFEVEKEEKPVMWR